MDLQLLQIPSLLLKALLVVLVCSAAAIEIQGSCTVNFVSQNEMTTAVSTVSGQGGGGAIGAMGGMKKKKKQAHGQGIEMREKQQSLFVNQKFNCTGTLTKWIFAAKWEEGGAGRTKYPQLEIWRAEGTGSSVYNKVHSTTVSALSQMSSNSIYSLTLKTPLNVLSGDVLSVYQPEIMKSRLVVYFYGSDQELAQYYYKDRIIASISQINTGNMDVKDRKELPLISAVIDVSMSTTTTTTSTTTISSSSTTSPSRPSPPLTGGSSSRPGLPVKPSTSSSPVWQVLLPTNRQPSFSVPPPTTSSYSTIVTMGISDKTELSSFTQGGSISRSYPMHTGPKTTANLQPTKSSSSGSTQPNDIFWLSPMHHSASPEKPNQPPEDKTLLVIVLITLFVTIFTTCLTCITIATLCAIAIVVDKKRKNKSLGVISIPAGSRPNRYIQKSVSSPVCDEGGFALREMVVPLPAQTTNETNETGDDIRQNSARSSVASSCPSVSVHPADVTVTVNQYYDHLTTGASALNPSSPVSPYEMPVVPDETQPKNHYDLANEIYVPTEKQRKDMEEVKNDHDSLYKSLYEAQHGSDNDQAEKNASFFQESVEYWKPSCTKNDIYKQLASRRFREVPRHKMQIIKYLGSGQFATVNKAVWRMGGGDVEVAVKMIKEGAPENEKIKFLQEAAINGQFHHLNIVRLLGVVTVGEPAMIILELLRNGNLKKYLMSRRPMKDAEVSPDLPALLLSFCKQVAAGMDYLAKKAFVHRDVAARNILVSDQLICKVADFGMSRDLEDNSYYVSQGGLVPIKWTAPEALYYRKYSTASDVWSYGVLVFEIWSLGKKPFGQITNEQYIEQIDEGKRLPPPPGCSRAMYQLMIDSWHPEARDRPAFSDILQYFGNSSSSSSYQENLLSPGVTDDELVESETCTVLGGPLESAQFMFQDLQTKYEE